MYKIIGADRVEYGPVTTGQLNEWIAQGRANATSLVWAEGFTEWKPLGAIPEFAAALGRGAGTPQVIGPNIVQKPRTNSLSVAGLILGLLSVLTFWCCFNLVLALMGLVFSGTGLSQIKKSGGQETGRGLAIAGIILSALGLVMGLITLLVFGVMASMNKGPGF
jgi:GYF domain 2/Domain of unknown function (DUF4190)